MKTKTLSRETRHVAAVTAFLLVAASVRAAYVLSATTAGGGTVSADPPLGGYSVNQVVTLTATPADGWTFLTWQGDASGTNPILNITMNRDLCVQAVFGTPLNPTVTLSGAMLVLPQAPMYAYGTTLKLVAQPQPGYYFANWSSSSGGSQNPLPFTVTAPNPAIAPVFALLPAGEFALTAIPSGAGGVDITPKTNRFPSSAYATLRAVPEPGQTFTGWSGSAAGQNNPLTVAMDLNRVITANFTRHPTVVIMNCSGASGASPLTLSISGNHDERYDVQTCTNLGVWSTVATVTNIFGTASWTDLTATNSAQKYYRAIVAQ